MIAAKDMMKQGCTFDPHYEYNLNYESLSEYINMKTLGINLHENQQ